MIAMAAGRSPSGVEKAYAAEVPSKKNLGGKWMDEIRKGQGERTYSAKNTKTFVHTPGWCFAAFTPNASNAVRITRTVVQPW